MKIKKLPFTLSLILALSMSLTAFGITVSENSSLPTPFPTIPSRTVILGDHAYDMNYANDPANQSEIQDAVVKSDGKIYVKDFCGNFIDNTTNLSADISNSKYSEIYYKNKTGSAACCLHYPNGGHTSSKESTQPIFQTVQWKNHGIYLFGGHDESDSQLGNQLSNYSCEGYNYEIYEMKGVDPSKSVIIKNDQTYLKYDFIFTDTIIFNGKTYIIGDSTRNIKGDPIGWFNQNRIYQLKGVDPDKVIDVFMSGSTKDMSLQGYFTAYRQNN